MSQSVTARFLQGFLRRTSRRTEQSLLYVLYSKCRRVTLWIKAQQAAFHALPCMPITVQRTQRGDAVQDAQEDAVIWSRLDPRRRKTDGIFIRTGYSSFAEVYVSCVAFGLRSGTLCLYMQYQIVIKPARGSTGITRHARHVQRTCSSKSHTTCLITHKHALSNFPSPDFSWSQSLCT